MTYTPYIPKDTTPHRKGALDALKVPSLANGTRTPYKPPVAVCIGVNRVVPVGYEK